MGLFWDLIQQSQISSQRDRSDSMDSRLRALEREMWETRELLRRLLERLEQRFGEDIDGDGRIGR